jgi:hypothetical protein
LPKNEVAKLEANRLAFRAQLIQDFLTKERDHLKTIEGTLETLRTLISSEMFVIWGLGSVLYLCDGEEFFQFQRDTLHHSNFESYRNCHIQASIAQSF